MNVNHAVQAAQAAVDEVKALLLEAQAAFTDLKASFAADPTALTVWMNALFATADMGVTTFSIGGPAWPHCAAAATFSAKDGSEATEGVERMLAAFRKRYELERGVGAMQVCSVGSIAVWQLLALRSHDSQGLCSGARGAVGHLGTNLLRDLLCLQPVPTALQMDMHACT
jgi:hypothetical protein